MARPTKKTKPAKTINGYRDFLNSPFKHEQNEWNEWKNWYNNTYRKHRLNELGLAERNARKNYADFTTQSRNELTQAVRKLKSAVETDTLRRGLSYSTIPGTVIGSETKRMNTQIDKQNAAAKSAMDTALASVRVARGDLKKMDTSTSKTDKMFKSTVKINRDVVEAMSGSGKVDYTILENMKRDGLSQAAIDAKKANLDYKQKTWDTIRSLYSTRYADNYTKYLNKWLSERYSLGGDEKKYDATSTKDTLGNRLYWSGLASFNSLVDKWQSPNDKQWEAYNAKYNSGPRAQIMTRFAEPPKMPETFNLSKEFAKNGFFNDDGTFKNAKINSYFKTESAAYENDQKTQADLLGIKGKDAKDTDYYKGIKPIQANWAAAGYFYDQNDKDDVERFNNNLPPKSFLDKYSQSKEDQDRLRNGQLPAKMAQTLKNTEAVQNELKQYNIELNDLLKTNGVTEADINELTAKYPKIKEINRYTQMNASLQDYGRSHNNWQSIYDNVQRNQSIVKPDVDFDMLRQWGYDEKRGFAGPGDAIKTWLNDTKKAEAENEKQIAGIKKDYYNNKGQPLRPQQQRFMDDTQVSPIALDAYAPVNIMISKPFDINKNTQIIGDNRANNLTDILTSTGMTPHPDNDIIIQIKNNKAVGVIPYSQIGMLAVDNLPEDTDLMVFRAESVGPNGKILRYRDVSKEYAGSIVNRGATNAYRNSAQGMEDANMAATLHPVRANVLQSTPTKPENFYKYLWSFTEPDLSKQTSIGKDGKQHTLGSDLRPTQIALYGLRFDRSLLEDPKKVDAFLRFIYDTNIQRMPSVDIWILQNLFPNLMETGDNRRANLSQKEKREQAELVFDILGSGGGVVGKAYDFLYDLKSPYTPVGAAVMNGANEMTFGLAEHTMSNEVYKPVQIAQELHPFASTVGGSIGTLAAMGMMDVGSVGLLGKIAPKLARTAPILYEGLAGMASGAAYSTARDLVGGVPARQAVVDIALNAALGAGAGAASAGLRKLLRITKELKAAGSELRIFGGIKGEGAMGISPRFADVHVPTPTRAATRGPALGGAGPIKETMPHGIPGSDVAYNPAAGFHGNTISGPELDRALFEARQLRDGTHQSVWPNAAASRGVDAAAIDNVESMLRGGLQEVPTPGVAPGALSNTADTGREVALIDQSFMPGGDGPVSPISRTIDADMPSRGYGEGLENASQAAGKEGAGGENTNKHVLGDNTGVTNSAGIPKEKVNAILNTPKGSRPDPHTYLSKDYIIGHLSNFNNGVTKIVAQAPTGVAGPPSGTFIMPSFVADRLIVQAGGDISKLEEFLGLPLGALGDNPMRIEIAHPKGLRMPNGNELGANSRWIPGGYTSGGQLEAIIDPPSNMEYVVIRIK